MLDFRRQSQKPSFLTGSNRWRLFGLVMAVGLVVIFGFQARQIANILRFLAGSGEHAGRSGASEDSLDTRLPLKPPTHEIPGTFTSTPTAPVKPAAAQTAQERGPSVPAAVLGASVPQQSGAKDLLRVYGLDAQLAKLADGRPWQEGEDETLWKVMYRLRSFPLVDVERWSRGKPDLAELAKNPGPHRGDIFQLAGRMVAAAGIDVDPGVSDRFQLDQYYRCEITLDDGGKAVVFSPVIPKAWKEDDPAALPGMRALAGAAWKPGSPAGQPAGALAMFLKLGEKTGAAQPAPIFVAQRMAWHPPTLLGRLGMDAGLFDDIRCDEEPDDGAKPKPPHPDISQLQLSARDRECFYQLLAAAGRAAPEQLLGEAERELQRSGKERFSAEPLFLQPQQQQGRLVVLVGTVRQVIPVRVSDEDIVARLGIRQYYQLSLFTDDSQENPIVFCVRELPEGMPSGEGARYAEHVKVAGFFFKTWGYRSRMPVDEKGGVTWQMAPLLIGRRPVWHAETAPPRDPWSGAIAAGLLLLAALGVMAVLWRARRRDRQFRDQVIAKHLQPEPSVSLNDLGIQAEGKPDFSRLEELNFHKPEEPRDEAS